MENIKKYLIILILSLSINSEIMDNTELRIKEILPNLLSMDWVMYKISNKDIKEIQNTVKQKFFRKEVNTWAIIDADSSKYYAILDNVKGKSMPITFLAIFDDDKKLKDVSIIKYREPYGGEINSKKWLKQFDAYNDSSNYSVGKEISGISGATISVHSVSKGIRKLSLLIHKIINHLNR